MKIWEVGLAVIVAMIWGGSFVAIQIGVNNFPPLMFSALRFTLAAVPLVFFLPPPKVSWKLIVTIGVVLGVVKFSLLFIGMDVGLSAGLASLLVQSQVFFTLIFAALFLGQWPSRRQGVGILIAVLGIALVAGTVQGSATMMGLVLVLFAAMAWAVSNMMMQRAGPVQMINLMVWISLVPPIPLIVLSALFESANWPTLSQVTFEGIAALVYVTLLGTVFGFAAWGFLLSRLGAARIAPFALLVPIFGMAGSAVTFGESFGPVRLLGAAFVIMGLCYITFNKPRSGSNAV